MVRAFRGRHLNGASISQADAGIWATDEKSGIACAAAYPWVGIIGSPRWRNKELLEEERIRGTAAALRLAFKQWGKALFDKVAGDFAFAILDPRSGTGMLAIDRMGVHGLYYGEMDGVLVFGSNADLVRGYPGFGATIPPQAIYNFLQAYVCRSPATIYAEQRKLGPAECLYWQNGQGHVETYWRSSFVPNHSQGQDELAAKLVTEVREAVRRSLPVGRQEGVGGVPERRPG